jgi:endogenous inhibitor of DNA gyrase (YacG/DUF329 family)
LTYICEKCGKPFEPKDTSPAHLKRNPPRFCSRECGMSNRSNGQVVNCTFCGKSIYRRKSFLSETEYPFCSRRCFGLWRRAHYREIDEENREYKYQRRIALERDNYQCQDCGALDSDYWEGMYPEYLHLQVITHHLEERGPDRPPNHDASNLVTLCLSCHRKRHHD